MLEKYAELLTCLSIEKNVKASGQENPQERQINT